jgi:hypothetical protein
MTRLNWKVELSQPAIGCSRDRAKYKPPVNNPIHYRASDVSRFKKISVAAPVAGPVHDAERYDQIGSGRSCASFLQVLIQL